MRASILLTTLATATAACAVSPDVSPYPPDAQTGLPDASGPGPGGDAGGPPPDARPMAGDAGGPVGDAGPGGGLAGWPEPFLGSRVLISPDMMFAFRLPTITEGGSLLGWGILPAEDSNVLISMALYQDDGEGQPTDLISWTEAWPASDGGYQGTGTPVPAGDYWLVLTTAADLDVGQDPNQPVGFCLLGHPFGASFPSFFGAPSCTTAGAPNIYIQLGPLGP
jgi:hypothetical protein